jgi:hypothetical protein
MASSPDPPVRTSTSAPHARPTLRRRDEPDSRIHEQPTQTQRFPSSVHRHAGARHLRRQLVDPIGSDTVRQFDDTRPARPQARSGAFLERADRRFGAPSSTLGTERYGRPSRPDQVSWNRGYRPPVAGGGAGCVTTFNAPVLSDRYGVPQPSAVSSRSICISGGQDVAESPW